MAKTYGGRIRRTGRSAKRRTQRIVAKSKSSVLAARPGLNVSAAKAARFFASLPPMMRLKTSWHADTNYSITIANTAVSVFTGYFWIDPLRYDYAVNKVGVGADGTNNRGNRNWFGTEMESMFFQYGEGRFRTHVLNAQFSLDYTKVFTGTHTAATIASGQQPPFFQMVCAAVPQSFIRQSSGASHLVTDAGAFISGGPDYYSALSKLPGAKSWILPTDGSAQSQKNITMTIDAYEHTGQAQSIIVSREWLPAATFPTLTATQPDPSARQVFLFACRFRQLTSDASIILNYGLRAAYRLDQHMEFVDKVPTWPYLASGTSN